MTSKSGARGFTTSAIRKILLASTGALTRPLLTTTLAGLPSVTAVALVAALTAAPALAGGGAGSSGFGGMGGTDSASAAGGGGGVSGFVGVGGGGGGAGVTGGDGGDGDNTGNGAGAAGTGGTIAGGSGTDGGDATSGGSGGGGGGGGAHGAVGTGLPAAASTGGDGGDGGDSLVNSSISDGGGGGAGGYGAVVTGSGSLGTLNFAVTGGDGGGGGSTTALISLGGNGGTGGIGLLFTAPVGASFTVDAAVTGGNGGAAGTGTGNGTAGAGGAGIIGQNLAITMDAAGSVTGGLSGDGVTRADAITFSGGANTLSFLGATSNLTGNIGVSGGGSLTFDQSGIDTTVANVITGSGSVAKIGTAAVILSGANTYTGGTTLADGILQVANDSALGAGALVFTGGILQSDGGNRTIANNIVLNATGTVDINTFAGGLFGLTGDITGAGGLTLMNSSGILGVLSLAGNNTYSGTTTTTGFSRLVAGSTTAFSPNSDYDVHAGTSLELHGFDNTIRSLMGTGIVSNNTFGPAATLTIAPPSGTTTFSGLIADSGALLSLVKDGAGTQVLTSNNAYTGTTTVDGGVLSVNGSIASSSLTSVNSGGTLGGNGTVGDTTIASGTLAPGNSIGTLHVAGNLVFGAGSVYAVEVSPTAADRTDVTGTADLSGGTVEVTLLPGTFVAKRYTILDAAGGLGGTTFAGLDSTLLPGLTTSLDYDPNNVYLVTAANRTSPDFGALNLNQQAVAGTLLDHFDANGTLPSEFASLDANGLTLVSGELAAGAITAGIDSADKFLGALDGQLETAGAGAPGQDGGAAAYADENKAPSADRFAALDMSASHNADQLEPVYTRTWNVWGTAYGGSEETGGDPVVGSHDTRADTYGLVGGVSYHVDDTLVGIGLGGGWSDFSLSDGLGDGSANTFNAGVYGRQGFGNAYLSGALAYGFYDVETDRTVFGDVLAGDFDGHSFSGRAEAGYRFDTPLVAISPYAAFQAVAYHLPAYSETSTGAGPFALDYDSDTTTATRVELGARLDHAIALADGGLLTLSGRAAWAINGGTGRNVGAAFQSLPGTAFTIDGAEPDRNAALLDAGAEYAAPSGFFAAATFQGEFSGNVQSYSGKVKIGLTW